MVDTLVPGFLVASPVLRDPNFDRAVVALVEHGDEGSRGFMINRPAAASFSQVAAMLGVKVAATTAPLKIYLGGPVAPQSGWILFDPTGADAETMADAMEVTEHLALSTSRVLLEQIASGGGPARRILTLGYAGWAPGQLDGEFSRGVWVPVDMDDELVFDTASEHRWSAALTSAGIDPARISTSGSFIA